MRYLIAILVMMTVLLASISCSQAEEGTIPGNGDLEPITQAQPASTEPEAAPTGGEPASTEPEPAPETRGEEIPGDEGYREANPETNPETNGETGTVILPSEVWAETKGSRGDPGTTLEDSSAAPGILERFQVFLAGATRGDSLVQIPLQPHVANPGHVSIEKRVDVGYPGFLAGLLP